MTMTRHQADLLAALNLLSPQQLRILGRAIHIATEHGLLDELNEKDREALLEVGGMIMGASLAKRMIPEGAPA